MPNLALDVSNNNPATLGQVKASGCKLLICKATEGDYFKDVTLGQHRAIAKKLGIMFGSYLFLHTASKGNEAEFYLEYAKPGKGELVIIDAEGAGLDGMTVEALAKRAESCAQYLEGKGWRPILYSSASTWKEMILWVPALRRLRVWEAQYPGRVDRWFPTLYKLRVRLFYGVSVVLWQFSQTYLVQGHEFDCSLILGTLP